MIDVHSDRQRPQCHSMFIRTPSPLTLQTGINFLWLLIFGELLVSSSVFSRRQRCYPHGAGWVIDLSRPLYLSELPAFINHLQCHEDWLFLGHVKQHCQLIHWLGMFIKLNEASFEIGNYFLKILEKYMYICHRAKLSNQSLTNPAKEKEIINIFSLNSE